MPEASAPPPRLRWLRDDHPTYALVQQHVLDYWEGYLPALRPQLGPSLASFIDLERGPLAAMHDAWVLGFERGGSGEVLAIELLCHRDGVEEAWLTHLEFPGGAVPAGLDEPSQHRLVHEPRAQLIACELEGGGDRFELRWLDEGGATFGVEFGEMRWTTNDTAMSRYIGECERRRDAQPLRRRVVGQRDVQRCLRRASWNLRRVARRHAEDAGRVRPNLLRWKFLDDDEATALRWADYDRHLSALLPTLPGPLRALADPAGLNADELLHDAMVVRLEGIGEGVWEFVALCPNTRAPQVFELSLTFRDAELLGGLTSTDIETYLDDVGAGLDYVEFDRSTDGRYELRIAPWSADRPSFGFRFAEVEHQLRELPPGAVAMERRARGRRQGRR